MRMRGMYEIGEDLGKYDKMLKSEYNHTIAGLDAFSRKEETKEFRDGYCKGYGDRV